MNKYTEWEKNYTKAMTEDVYGGKTPQETLDMFIDALKKEDIELASKYFMLDTNEQPYNRENYMNRKKWEDGLKKTKEAGKLQEISVLLTKLKPDKESSSIDTAWFSILNSEGIADYGAILKFNEYSKVWKIESL